MTRSFAEILLFALLAMNAGLLIFIAGVLRKVMNEMDEAAFKQFVMSLVRHSKRSPFMLTVLDIPLLGAIPYLYFYGFGNRWLIAGLALWLVSGGIAKLIKLPVYKAVAALDAGDGARLEEARHKLNAGNMFQAILNSVAVLVALVGFVG
ncbi:MAG: hypothetical protein WCC26_13455 [Terracidiphilus sp.]